MEGLVVSAVQPAGFQGGGRTNGSTLLHLPGTPPVGSIGVPRVLGGKGLLDLFLSGGCKEAAGLMTSSMGLQPAAIVPAAGPTMGTTGQPGAPAGGSSGADRSGGGQQAGMTSAGQGGGSTGGMPVGADQAGASGSNTGSAGGSPDEGATVAVVQLLALLRLGVTLGYRPAPGGPSGGGVVHGNATAALAQCTGSMVGLPEHVPQLWLPQ